MKEKQIEEMAKLTCQMYCRGKEKKCAGVQECDCKCLHYNRCEAAYNFGFRKQSEEAPAADVVEVVRCKDCAVPHNKWTGCPNLNGLVPPPDFYCAFGVRMSEAEK